LREIELGQIMPSALRPIFRPAEKRADRGPVRRCPNFFRRSTPAGWRDLCGHMARKKTLKDFTEHDLMDEMARRHAARHFVADMTMSQMELSVWRAFGTGEQAQVALAVLLGRLKDELPTAKPCPKCTKRVPVRAADRERTLTSLVGPVTLKRNYHYCEDCKFGFCPLDLRLELPESGELTSEMEKRALDFSVNDVFDECAQRWRVHYERPLSPVAFRHVAERVGKQCEAADQGRLQEKLKAADEKPAECLVIEVDGSMLPIRGLEPWKEAKVGVTYRHNPETRRPVKDSGRYIAIVGGMSEFAPVLEEALEIERVDEAVTVLWVGDGAASNWTLADQLAPDAVQILDWYHAVEHAMACGRELLGEESDCLAVWKLSVEQLLATGEPELFIAEMMDCVPLIKKGRRHSAEALKAIDDLVRYYRENASRMKYRLYREHGFPIGSGAVESAHRHVLQVRMKRAGQHWAMRNARRMARLRAAYRTAGAFEFHSAIQRAHRETLRLGPLRRERRRNFRYARYGTRDLDNARKSASM